MTFKGIGTTALIAASLALGSIVHAANCSGIFTIAHLEVVSGSLSDQIIAPGKPHANFCPQRLFVTHVTLPDLGETWSTVDADSDQTGNGAPAQIIGRDLGLNGETGIFTGPQGRAQAVSNGLIVSCAGKISKLSAGVAGTISDSGGSAKARLGFPSRSFFSNSLTCGDQGLLLEMAGDDSPNKYDIKCTYVRDSAP